MLVTFSLYYNKTNKMYMNADSTMNVLEFLNESVAFGFLPSSKSYLPQTTHHFPKPFTFVTNTHLNPIT